MSGKINVTINGEYLSTYPKGIELMDIAKEYQHMYQHDIFGALVNNNLRELSFVLEEDSNIEFIDITSSYGNRFYSRSLSFLLIIAAKEVLKKCRVRVEHSLSKGLYCEIYDTRPLNEEIVKEIEDKMFEIVEEDIPFIKRRYPKNEAEKIFRERGQLDKIRLLKYRSKEYINLYSCKGYYDYFYGYLVPSTRYLKNFELKFYSPGLILRFPERKNPEELPRFFSHPKLFNVFREFAGWGKIMEIEDIGHLNDFISQDKMKEMIWIAEALHEKKIAEISDMITNSPRKKKLALISGPSSSGKTTFAKRLSIQLRANGLKAIEISIDDFFKNREDTPLTPEGEYNFETIEAIDVDLFNDVINRLIEGEEVEIPSFNFHTGQREWLGRKLKITEDQIIIAEGIHGLNDRLTEGVPSELKFKIYISPLTHLNIDNHNRIPTSDLRLIRRMVRDYQFRSTEAFETIKMWDSVRRGEDKYIYPFQEEADVMFNSSLAYELSVLKETAVPLLNKVASDVIEHVEAKRLIKFFNYVLPFDSKYVPMNSILREFIGNSCFDEAME